MGLRASIVFASIMSEPSDEEFQTQLSRTVRKLAHLSLSPVQTEVLKELMNGNRTMAELTLVIFNSRYTDERFEAYHSRTKRAVKSLEKQGLVAKRRLLGRDKPYGLTHHGMARIVSIIPDLKEPAVIQRLDLVLFPATCLIGIAALYTLDRVTTNVFSLLLGITLVRAIGILRRIS